MATSLGPLELGRHERRNRDIRQRIAAAHDIDFLTESIVSVFGGIILDRLSLPGNPLEARLAKAPDPLGAAIDRTHT